LWRSPVLWQPAALDQWPTFYSRSLASQLRDAQKKFVNVPGRHLRTAIPATRESLASNILRMNRVAVNGLNPRADSIIDKGSRASVCEIQGIIGFCVAYKIISIAAA
jgi:hypothetical protein